MSVNCGDYGEIGDQLLITLFENQNRLPNKATVGLNRSQSKLIREAISSDSFDQKKGSSLNIWTPECRIHLLRLGPKEEFDPNSARTLGAKFMSSISKKKRCLHDYQNVDWVECRHNICIC